MELLASILAAGWVFGVMFVIGVSFVFGFPLSVGFFALLVSQLRRERAQKR